MPFLLLLTAISFLIYVPEVKADPGRGRGFGQMKFGHHQQLKRVRMGDFEETVLSGQFNDQDWAQDRVLNDHRMIKNRSSVVLGRLKQAIRQGHISPEEARALLQQHAQIEQSRRNLSQGMGRANQQMHLLRQLSGINRRVERHRQHLMAD